MWLWLLLGLLVVMIVGLEIFQAQALKRLGATPPRSIKVLRIMNIVLLVSAIGFAAWVVVSRGR